MNGWFTIILSLLGTTGMTAVIAAVVERRKRGADVYATTMGANVQFIDRIQADGARLSTRLDAALMRIDEMELREDERDRREALKDEALHQLTVWSQQAREIAMRQHPPLILPPSPRSPLERT